MQAGGFGRFAVGDSISMCVKFRGFAMRRVVVDIRWDARMEWPNTPRNAKRICFDF